MKTKEQKTLYLIALIGILTVTPVVSAADFTLRLGMNVTKLPPEVEQIKVRCWVNADFASSQTSVLGETIVNVSAFGNVLTPVEVTIDVPDSFNPITYNQYQCRMDFLISGVGGTSYPLPGDHSECLTAIGLESLSCAKPGTVLIQSFEDNFSQ